MRFILPAADFCYKKIRMNSVIAFFATRHLVLDLRYESERQKYGKRDDLNISG